MESSPAEQLIDRKGGTNTFAAAIGKRPGAVRMMRHRKRLPREVWPEIMTAFPDVSLEDLLATEPAAGEAAA